MKIIMRTYTPFFRGEESVNKETRLQQNTTKKPKSDAKKIEEIITLVQDSLTTGKKNGKQHLGRPNLIFTKEQHSQTKNILYFKSELVNVTNLKIIYEKIITKRLKGDGKNNNFSSSEMRRYTIDRSPALSSLFEKILEVSKQRIRNATKK